MLDIISYDKSFPSKSNLNLCKKKLHTTCEHKKLNFKIGLLHSQVTLKDKDKNHVSYPGCADVFLVLIGNYSFSF